MSASELPPGWQRVRFGDVVRKVSDRVDPETSGIDRYVAGEHMETDDLRIRSWGEVGDGYLGPAFHMRFQPGQVLYGSRRTYLRKVAAPDFEGICANTTFVLEPSSDGLLPEFLPLMMTTERFHEHSIQQSKGSVNPYINFSDIAWYEFALPPVDEQTRIVQLFRAIDRSVDSLHEAASQATLLALLQFDSRVEASGVESTELATFADWRRGYSFKGSDYANGSEFPFLTLASVERGGGYRPDGLKFLKAEPKPTCIASSGELLVANTDLTPGREFIGRPFLVPDSLSRAGFSHHLSMVSVEDPTLPEWLFWEMQTPSSRRFVRSIARGSTVIMLDMKAIGKWPLRVPPESIRVEILHQVQVASSLARAADEDLFGLANLRKSLLRSVVGGLDVH